MTVRRRKTGGAKGLGWKTTTENAMQEIMCTLRRRKCWSIAKHNRKIVFIALGDAGFEAKGTEPRASATNMKLPQG